MRVGDLTGTSGTGFFGRPLFLRTWGADGTDDVAAEGVEDDVDVVGTDDVEVVKVEEDEVVIDATSVTAGTVKEHLLVR